MCSAEQPQLGSIYLLDLHVLTLCFHLKHSLFYLTSFDLKLLLTSSYLFIPLFLTENEAEIIFFQAKLKSVRRKKYN